jgi:cation diffusion facilitator family transporter
LARNRKRRISGDLAQCILLILRKEGPQNLQQLQEKTALQTSGLHNQTIEQHAASETSSVVSTCDDLARKKLIKLADNATYELTAEGRVQAEEIVNDMESLVRRIETQILNPSAAARNATAGYFVLAILKMLAGFFSGSVGLIADGADTTVDTASSAIVWAGIKLKKDTLGTMIILGLMFLTAAILFYDSASSIIKNVHGIFPPISMPIMVIVIELIAMLSMFVLSMYQRIVGNRNQSLALISQSIDSKNSVYSSAAVIVGVIFSIFGIYWVDAIVGAFIAVRISIDGISLTREVAKSMSGQQPEFSKFKLPIERRFEQSRLDNFRNWILYSIYKNKLCTKQELVASLEKTFRPSYLPTSYNEFRVGTNVNFENDFSDLIKPLINEAYIVETNGAYSLTSKGKIFIKDTVDTLRYKETEL